MQCKVPSPSTRSRQGMPIISRFVNNRARAFQCHAIVSVAECWNQHHPVCDIEIRITRREPLVIEIDRLRHRQSRHPEIASAPVGG